MHKRQGFNLRCLFCFGTWLIFFTSCQQGKLELGDDFINSNSYTALIDTVSIQLSTIKADSVATSGTGNGLVGYYHHPLTGGQEAKSYFSLYPPASFTWNKATEVFDSLVMVLQPNTYSIGDTLMDALFKVHELSHEIKVHTNGKLYNTSVFACDDETIGQTLFRPSPKHKEELNIRLSDSYALDLIHFLTEYENHNDKHTLFKDKFKGFVLKSDTSITRSALGFTVSDTTAYLRLYSHINGLEKEEITKDFSLASENTYFNQVSSPNQTVIYNQLCDGKDILKEQDSNGTVLLQAGTGFKIRIDFPTLNNLLELKSKGHIVKAELRLKPDMSVMRTTDLPAHVFIGDIYIANNIWGYLTDGDGNPIPSALLLDHLYHEDTYYSFDLTNYINSRLTEQVIDSERGLVITLPNTDIGNSFTWLALKGQTQKNNQSKLLLYYYYYDTE